MLAKLPTRCQQRSHRWDKGPQPGSVCTRAGCGKKFGERRTLTPEQRPRPIHAVTPGEPQRPTLASSPAPAGASVGTPSDDRFARLRARLSGSAPANDNGTGQGQVIGLDAQPSSSATPGKLAVDKATLGKLVDIVGPLAPQLIVGIEASIVRWAGRVPEIPDKEWVAKLRECTDLIIKTKLPDVEIGPWGGLGIYSTMVFLSMYMGAEKLPPKPAAASLPPGPRTTTANAPQAPASARTPATADASGSPSTTPFPTSDETQTTAGGGNATSAPAGPSDLDDVTASAGSVTNDGKDSETATTFAPTAQG